MISIIISTHRPEFYEKVAASIEQTIGEEFEIISIENNGQYSLSQAYNMGAERAQYQFLCFVHEDVLFETNNWGTELIRQIKSNKKIGLIGIVGSKIFTRFSMGWYCPFYPEIFLTGHLNQGQNSWEKYKYENFSPVKEYLDEVVVLDGVFLFTTKKIWENNKFDEKLITGFHGYDIDFSMQIMSRGFKIFVDKSIILRHYSLGKCDRRWFTAIKNVTQKWKTFLPVKASNVNIGYFSLLKMRILQFSLFVKSNIRFLLSKHEKY